LKASMLSTVVANEIISGPSCSILCV